MAGGFQIVAGEGFEPPSSRLWASRAAAALPRDKNYLYEGYDHYT